MPQPLATTSFMQDKREMNHPNSTLRSVLQFFSDGGFILGHAQVPTCRVYVWVDLEDAQMAEHNFRAAQDVSKAFEDFIAKFEKLLGQRGHG